MVDKTIGFSLWLDFVEREYLQTKFSDLIDKNIINGATSNPAIFAKAISSSPAYQEQLASLQNMEPKHKYEALAIEDIKLAAKALEPLYEENNDGFISIEVDPFLSGDKEATLEEARRLHKAIGYENVMIKIPATDAGYDVMQTLLSEGISVNATLIFTNDQARKCAQAMDAGIKASSEDVSGVISVFVSRFDRAVDAKLEKAGIQPSLTGIYNAARIYNTVEGFKNPSLRTLFASTGVKGDNLSPDYYIKNLLAPHSVNTAPLDTIDSYIQNVSSEVKLPVKEEVISAHFDKLADIGIDVDTLGEQLLADGLKAFEDSFADMLARLD
ncbi:MAG: transaldolase [Campylobacterota bacterium]